MAGKQDHLLIPQPVMVSPFRVLLEKKLTEQDHILEMRKKKKRFKRRRFQNLALVDVVRISFPRD